MYSNWRCVSIIHCYEGWPVIRYFCVISCCKILFVFYCIVLYGIVVNFVGIKFAWILLSSLCIIYEDLYTWCLRYNIWSAWFLDTRISTCYNLFKNEVLYILCTEQLVYTIRKQADILISIPGIANIIPCKIFIVQYSIN